MIRVNLVMCVALQVKDFGKGMTPIDRAGQPAELAPAFVFLANNAGDLAPFQCEKEKYASNRGFLFCQLGRGAVMGMAQSCSCSDWTEL